MSTRQQKYDAYKARWSAKPEHKIRKELESMRRYLERNKDTFFHECSPDDLTDGLRIMALREALDEKQTIRKS